MGMSLRRILVDTTGSRTLLLLLQELVLALCLANIAAVFHRHLLHKYLKVVIIITMNTQNGPPIITMNTQNGPPIDEPTQPSQMTTRPHLSAGAISVEPRRIPTRVTESNRRSGNTIDNDCTTTNINIATYNIRDGRNSNLEAALRACEKMRIHFGILTETRLSTDRYTRSAYGYTVFATKSTHSNQGGIALIFTNNSLYFQVEGQQKHGPNVISCILVTGKRQHYIIGAYIPPHDTTTLTYISEASQRFAGKPIILMGDINVDLRTTTPDARATEIMALISTLGLEDMSTHFRQRQQFRHGIRCNLCGMFCTPLQLAGSHQNSVVCRKGAKRNKQKQLDLQCIRAFRRTFQIQNQPIETVKSFRYLGRIITSNDNDWTAAYSNLQKARQQWANISRVLTRESASPRISALFYKATVQAILLYGSETWVVTDEILQLLTSFHHGIARRLTGRYPRPPTDDTDEEWTHPSIQETLRLAGLFPMEEYLRRRRGYLEQHVQGLQLLCDSQNALTSTRPSRRRVFWWNQPLANTHLLTQDDTITDTPT